MDTEQAFPINHFDELLVGDLSGQKPKLNFTAIIAVTDRNGIIKYVNNKFCMLSGYSRQEIIGKNHRLVNSGYHSPAFYKNLWDTILTGKIWKGEIRNKNKSGEYYWEDVTIVPFMDKNQKPIQYLSIRHEITKLKESQEIKYDQHTRMAIASKYLALGEMAANLTHEINNPLGVILGRCEMLMNYLDRDSIDTNAIKKMVEHIEYTSRRIENIINSMRSFSTMANTYSFDLVVLFKLINETVEFVQQRFKDHGIELVVTDFDPELSLECYFTEISQIVLNLLNNAFDAVQLHDKKWVKIEVLDMLDQVEISITDSGKGIPIDYQSRLFDPFFSTKEKKYGTGLGLSISKGFAEKHNASLEYEPSSKNTHFRLLLPKRQINRNNI